MTVRRPTDLATDRSIESSLTRRLGLVDSLLEDMVCTGPRMGSSPLVVRIDPKDPHRAPVRRAAFTLVAVLLAMTCFLALRSRRSSKHAASSAAPQLRSPQRVLQRPHAASRHSHFPRPHEQIRLQRRHRLNGGGHTSHVPPLDDPATPAVTSHVDEAPTPPPLPRPAPVPARPGEEFGFER
jgi:hypothetical protein